MPTINEVLKTDLAFTDDFFATAAGDFDVVSGLANLKEAILRRILTRPGTIVHRPTYGVGLGDFQNAPLTLSVKRQLANRIREQITLDPRVEEVLSVSVASEDDYAPETVKIGVRCKVVGYGESEFSYTPLDTRV